MVADGSARRAAAVLGAVANRTPADKAGLKTGAAITTLDGESIDGSLAFVAQIHERNVGDKVTRTVLRGGQTIHFSTSLVAKPTTAK